LAYHSVRDVPWRDDPWGLAVAPRTLVRHIRLLRRRGYAFVTFGTLATGLADKQAENLCSLTFDDGFADNLSVLVPLLEAERATATVFVVSSMLGRTHPDAPWARTLTAEEVRAVHDAGVEVGGHGASHVDLTALGEGEVTANLRRCRAELGDILGTPPDVLAYPFGRADETTRRAAEAAGFRAACRVGAVGNRDDPFDLPRAGMNSSSTTFGLRLKIQGRYDPLMRTAVGRAARSAWRRTRAPVH
jgi:peptidoglycan/xylan/chitin deacetylase (PgdA/CDA1 family)